MTSTIDACRQAMHAAGLDPGSAPLPDGETHRFHVSGDRRGSRNGWYCFHADAPVNATFGTYKQSGIVHHWQGRDEAGSSNVLVAQGIPRVRCSDHSRIWNIATPARDIHPYLARKGVPAIGLRYYKGALLVPVLDMVGELQGLQRIWPDGTKRFTPGTMKVGNAYIIGDIHLEIPAYICEGYATGATIYLATGHPVVVAFDAGNLLAVAQAIRAKFADLAIIVAGDNDHATEGNPGLMNATEAARTVRGGLTVPVFSETKGADDTDFNDLAKREGLDVVRLQLLDAGGRYVPCM